MNFCNPYRGREILNVRPRPRNTFSIVIKIRQNNRLIKNKTKICDH